MICHGGSIAGKSYVGLGNSSLDFQTFSEDLSRAMGRSGKTPFTFSNVRGTTEAGGIAVFLLGYREPDLSLRLRRLDLDLHDDMCEDTPAWWLLKKKKTMYYDGGGDQRSVRSLMQFMMSPLNFAVRLQDGRAGFQGHPRVPSQLQPPKYPLPIDAELADRGEVLFTANCARCHGTYGENWTYPNKVVPIDKIGTDRKRFDGLSKKFGEYYNKSWFAEEYKAAAVGRLPGAAAGRHLGHGPLLPQRLRADGLRRAELEGAAEGVHAVVPHRPGRLRRGEARLEGGGAGRGRPTRRRRRPSSGGRCTTRRSPAAATAATPTATA